MSKNSYTSRKRNIETLPVSWENRLRHFIFSSYSRISTPIREPEYLLVLGHMRAGSSLLSQLLANNPAILGFGELHLGYSRPGHLRSMIGKNMIIHRRLLLKKEERYVMDKLLHDYLLQPQQIDFLVQRRVRVIFLLRRPLPTIKSILRIMDYSIEDALQYYTQRVSSLVEYAARLPEDVPKAVVTYQQLIGQTEQTFKALEQHLELEHPLQEQYRVTSTTQRGNDPSKNLRAGRIIRQKSYAVPQPEVSRSVIGPAEVVFAKTMEALKAECVTCD